VQILVVVAIIQTSYTIIGRALKAVVEKVSLRVALSQGLVGPEDQVNSEYKSEMILIRKGIRLIFRNFRIQIKGGNAKSLFKISTEVSRRVIFSP